MKTHKACRFDGIDVEHMVYGHSTIVVWLLSMRYYAFVTYQLVLAMALLFHCVRAPLVDADLSEVPEIKNHSTTRSRESCQATIGVSVYSLCANRPTETTRHFALVAEFISMRPILQLHKQWL